jgi:hypothetical protein
LGLLNNGNQTRLNVRDFLGKVSGRELDERKAMKLQISNDPTKQRIEIL